MNQFEIFFDGFYLSLIIFLGIRMLLIENNDSKILGSMALLLGLGDSFHLVPRIIANVSENGFIENSFGLFLGTRVSAITMSVFYLLFYYYIKKKNNMQRKELDTFLILLFVIRIATVIISFNHSEEMDLISNVPFVLMGIIDILLLFKNKNIKEFKNLYIYVLFSFLFYVPVVLLKNVYPIIGMLMMPKTIMYVLIVIKLYKNLKKDFEKKDIMEFAISYLLSGILAGAVYRELRKIYPVDVKMAFVHTHLIVLGFVFLAIFYLIAKNLEIPNEKLEKLIRVYNFGIYFSFTTMFLHGLVDSYPILNSVKIAMTSISGIGHILITLSIILISIMSLRSREVLKA
ncbi:DUF2871 family protein [Peptoniphilus sp.]|uniref:DUF2871 family protein n=1 Tax=Peptoniphilus sp. TaxID=1971214 RepID=UPI002A81E1B8|nr:DUF2871 family protein [Peptoniphilus sp.]MDY3903281.1 DUF2871 family protein [Peptoniphilus sp.]